LISSLYLGSMAIRRCPPSSCNIKHTSDS